MEKSHQPTSVSYRLLKPHNGLGTALAFVILRQAVLGHSVTLVYGADRKDEQDGEGWPGDKREEFGVCEGVDIVDLEGL